MSDQRAGLSDEELLALLRKHLKDERGLVRVVWKDGIDLDEPSYSARLFADEIYRAGRAAALEEAANVRAALAELVACKDLKDRGWHMRRDGKPADEIAAVEREYAERKFKAWAAARAALSPPAGEK